MGILETNYADSLMARTLVRFANYPDRTTVRDTTGTNRTDSTLTFVQGALVARFNRAASTNTGPVDLAVAAVQEVWDPFTATWENAVDTIGGPVPWSTPVTTAAPRGCCRRWPDHRRVK